tara:strand:+ start:12133 stop:13641 length:1509 start_codon:yes stop_codon:yes gene_type:complete
MSILQADGLEFGDGSVIEGFYFLIPQSKRMVFYQAAAPTGWTKLTQVSAPGDLDGSAIRVTSGAGGSVVGTTDFTTAMPLTPKAFASVSSSLAAGSVGPHTLSLSEIASHDHQIGSREVDDGPPAPTAYQATLQRSYAERLPITNQRAYQQPSVYQQPLLYQQPDAYPQPQNRQSSVNRQNPGTYQRPTNPISRERYQQPHLINQQRDSVQNRGQDRQATQARGHPVRGNMRVPGQFQQQRNQGRMQQRVAQAQRPTHQNRGIAYQNPQNRSARVRPGGRPDRHRQRRNRRRPYFRQNRRVRSPTRTNRAQSRQNPNPFPASSQARAHREPAPFTGQTQGQVNIRQNRRVQYTVRQNRAFNFQEPLVVPRQNPRPEPNPNPVQNTTPFRNPSTARQPSSTPVTVNAQRNTYTTVNANTNVPVRVTQVYQQSNVNFSPYPQPLIVPGDTIRGDNTNSPNTSLTGGGDAHTHPFTGDDFSPQITAPSGFSLRVQYIDVIVCSID